MRSVKRTLVLSVFALLALTSMPARSDPAADYPNGPVKILVPFAAGGPTDVMARILGQKLSVALGQQIVVENKPGAGSTIGAEFVAKAARVAHQKARKQPAQSDANGRSWSGLFHSEWR